MGNPIRAQAEKLGLTVLPKTVLYAQPSGVRQTLVRCTPNIDRTVQNYIKQLDPSFIKGRSGGVASHTYSIISPKERIYLEDTVVFAGVARRAENHVLKITIYTDDEEKRNKIAQVINDIFYDGMLANIDWNKIEKKYNVRREDCIKTWQMVLGQNLKSNEGDSSSTITPTKEESPNSNQEFKFCTSCGTKNISSNKFCIKCGQPF
ncbi:MAG: zinc-ribbon domain-containing protein [Promethearchaeota archaeon]|nr:MAG: zinc-ribbon domain-containing protein [Candidatus Lokiarchaeota archaeon]